MTANNDSGIELTRDASTAPPQTVLKTAGLAITIVYQRPLQFDNYLKHSTVMRTCSLMSGHLAVSLAINGSLQPIQNWRSDFTECR